MPSAGARRINCLHYWNALSFALFEYVNWIGYCRHVGYCSRCCCRLYCCWRWWWWRWRWWWCCQWRDKMEFTVFVRLVIFLCGYQNIINAEITPLFSIHSLFWRWLNFSNWFFVGYRVVVLPRAQIIFKWIVDNEIVHIQFERKYEKPNEMKTTNVGRGRDSCLDEGEP